MSADTSQPDLRRHRPTQDILRDLLQKKPEHAKHHLSRLTNENLQGLTQSILTAQKQQRQEQQLRFYQPVSEKSLTIHTTDARVVGVGGGNGSCLPLWAPVQVGYPDDPETCDVALGEVKPGDFVWSADPNTGEMIDSEVVRVYRSGKKTVFALMGSYRSELELMVCASAEHQIPVRSDPMGETKKASVSDILSRFDRGESIYFVKAGGETQQLRAWVSLGIHECGDIEVADKNHCYVSNGFIVSNSKTETCLVEMVMCATGVFPASVAEHIDVKEKFRGPIHCRVVCESLTTVLHPIILPKLQWWKWTGVSEPGGEKGHWGWVPRNCLIAGSWERSWSEKLRQLRVLCRDPETNQVVGESTIQFMCLRGDQRVLMADGTWREVSQIKIGDRVHGPATGPVPVVKTFEYEDAPLLRIRCQGGREIISTPNHRHLMQDGTFRSAEDISPGDTIAAYVEESPGGSPVERWKLGWTAIMIGDGYIKGKQAKFTAKAPSRVLDDLPPMPPGCKLYEEKPGIGWAVTLDGPRRGNPLVGLLQECGLWGKGSGDKFVPDFVFKANMDGRSYFLKHLWHTDGTVNDSGRQAVYRTISRRLAYDVKYLVWSLGVRASIVEANGICGFTGKPVHSYGVCISGKSFDRMKAILDGREFKGIPASTIKTPGKVISVETHGFDRVHCIEVGDWRHQIVCDGLVTENSRDQDPSDFASGDFHIILHDEPPTLAIWRENQARTMRVRGRMLLAMTWPDDPAIPVDWIFDEVYEPANEGAEGKVWINLWTTENPNLDQEAVAAQERDWDQKTADVRLRGKPIRFSNRIHALFTDQDDWWCFRCGKTTTPNDTTPVTCLACGTADVAMFNHVRDFTTSPGWPCIWVIDPHPRKPHMYQWWQVDPSDDLWLVATGECDGDPDQVKEDVDRIESELRLFPTRRLIDPNMGRSPSSSTRRHLTWQDDFDAVGLTTDLADDSDVGRGRINEYLRPDDRTLQPRLHIHPRCQRAIFQFKRYVWDDHKQALDKDLKQKPKTKNDDDPTMAKYVLNAEPSFRGLLDAGQIVRRRPEAHSPRARQREYRWQAQ